MTSESALQRRARWRPCRDWRLLLQGLTSARFLLIPALVSLAAPRLGAQQTVEYRVRSDTLPRLVVEVSSTLTYLGPLRYDVGGVAQASEFVFADTAAGILRRVFIVHFEHFLPDNDKVFRYPRLDMVRLGAGEYLHQTWALEEFALFSLPAMRGFLAARGLHADGRWLVDRYVRTVDPSGKHEIILFYAEAAAVNEPGIRYGGGVSDTEPPPTPPAAIRSALVHRAMGAFTIRDR